MERYWNHGHHYLVEVTPWKWNLQWVPHGTYYTMEVTMEVPH